MGGRGGRRRRTRIRGGHRCGSILLARLQLALLQGPPANFAGSRGRKPAAVQGGLPAFAAKFAQRELAAVTRLLVVFAFGGRGAGRGVSAAAG